ncbi:hypothetical protein ACFXNW_20365 [Nocardia sp. NPDC059180]|uniref:hypothetical protein n=1 Tax=Nocardia sp. NPDC059180 TaxID=3346761 RepID=UPI0036788CB8
MGWRSWVAGAVTIAAPIVGNVMLPGVGGFLGAAVGGMAADYIERDGFSAQGMLMGGLNGLAGGSTGKGISMIGKWATKRADAGIKAANAANKAARSGAPAAGRRAYQAEYNKQIRAGTNTVDAERRARAAGAAAKRDHLKNNTVKVPDATGKWPRLFHNGSRGKVGANGKRGKPQRTGAASNALQGGGSLAYWLGNKPGSGGGGGSGGNTGGNGASGTGGTGEWVGAHVQSAGKSGTPFVRHENTGTGIVDKPAETWGVLWQPAKLSSGMKDLWGGKTAAA